MISACFQKVARMGHSVLLRTILLSLLSPHILEKHQVSPTNVPAVFAVALGAGWGVSENPAYPTSSYQRSQAKSQASSLPWIPFLFLQKMAGIPHQMSQKPRHLSHSGHAQKKKKNKNPHKCQNPLKTLAAARKLAAV